MAELKPMEVIMRIDFVASDGEQICAHAEKVQELIRCKDCKWCVEHYDTRGNVPYWRCKNWDGGTEADGFCHEAERRTDG